MHITYHRDTCFLSDDIRAAFQIELDGIEPIVARPVGQPTAEPLEQCFELALIPGSVAHSSC